MDANSAWESVTESEAYVTLEMYLIDQTKKKIHTNETIVAPHTLKVSTLSHTTFLAKNSFLKPAFDGVITQLNENGLLEKWSAQYRLSAMYHVNDAAPRKLNLSQFLGVIELCSVFLLMAAMVFVFEILYSIRLKSLHKNKR